MQALLTDAGVNIKHDGKEFSSATPPKACQHTVNKAVHCYRNRHKNKPEPNLTENHSMYSINVN